MRLKVWIWLAPVLAVIAGLWGCGCERSSSGATDGEFRIEPAEHRFATNSFTVVLSIVGGKAPFTWTVADPDMGELSGVPMNAPTEVAVANYRRFEGFEGVNTVWVEDSRGWAASSLMRAPSLTP